MQYLYMKRGFTYDNILWCVLCHGHVKSQAAKSFEPAGTTKSLFDVWIFTNDFMLQRIKFFTIQLTISQLYDINIYLSIYFDQHIDIFCLDMIYTLPSNCTNISIFRIVHLKFLRLEFQVLYTLKHDILWSEDPPRCCFLARSW